MKSTSTFFMLLLMATFHQTFSQQPTFDFIKNVAFNSNADIQMHRITIAEDGSIYVAGMSDLGDAYFANGDTITDNTLPFRRDGFIAKFDATGNVIWTKEFDSGDQYGLGGIEVDRDENIYLAGRSEDTTLIDGLTIPDHTFYWFKLDSNGVRLDYEYYQSTSAMQGSFVKLAVDSIGNSYVSGLFNGSMTIGSNTYGASNGSCFMFKINDQGNLAWSKQINSGYAGKLLIAQNGNLIYGGICNRGASFGTFTCASTNTAQRSNPLLSEIDASTGNPLWILNPQGNRGGNIVDIHQITDGSYVFGGAFGDDSQPRASNRLNFGNGITAESAGSPLHPLFGTKSSYLAKADASGNPIWAKRVGQRLDPYDNVKKIIGHGDSIYVMGQTRDTNYLYNANDSIAIRTFNNSAFVATVDGNGGFQKVRPIAVFNNSIGLGLMDAGVDPNGSLYITGSFDEDYKYSDQNTLVLTGRNDAALGKVGNLDPFTLPVPQNLRTTQKNRTEIFTGYYEYDADIAWSPVANVYGYVLTSVNGYNQVDEEVFHQINDTTGIIVIGNSSGLSYSAKVSSHKYDVLSLSTSIMDTSGVTITSIKGLDKANAYIKYYPNPTENLLNISSSEKINSVRVINIAGQTLMFQSMSQLTNCTLTLADLPSGIYFIEVSGEDFKEIQKVQKR